MAYIITINNQIHKIASNDVEKNEIAVSFPPFEAIDISDDDFSKLKNDSAWASISEGSVTITDSDMSISYENEDELKQYIENIKPLFKNFIHRVNESKSLYSTINSYYTTLNTYDYSSINYPLNTTREKYCEDNSIDYINTLQIP